MSATNKNKKHVKKRAKERYGIDLSNRKIKKIYALINSNEANFLGNGGNHTKRYGVTIDGKRLWVLYDFIDRRLLTVLTNDGTYKKTKGTKNAR